MKRIGAFSLAIFIFVLSVFSVIPVDVYADDDKTVLSFTFKQLNHSVGAGMSASDANAVVTAHKDIYTSDGTLLFIYNPSNSYNWTTSTAAYYVTLNYSDEQLKNILMSKNPFMTLFSVSQALSNNNGIRAFCAGLGTIFSGSSDMGTKVLDTLTGNYNYLDSLNYDENSQTITMSNDNGCVDKLREEIKKYYYNSIGCFYIKSSGKPFNAVNDFKTKYEYDDDLNSDLTASNNFDSAISFKQYSDYVLNYFWDDSDFDYLFFDNCGNGTSYYPKVLTYSNDGLTKHNPCGVMTSFYGTYSLKNGDSFKSNKFIGNYNGSNIVPLYNKDNIAETNFLASKFDCSGYFTSYTLIYYSKTGKPFTPFKSYSAYYNFINGGQNAYLSSQIHQTGLDLQFSINNMSQNFTEQMDKLIDNLNENKSSMSADELQNAIDKGLADLNKNTEDIKDNSEDIKNNTSSILEKLEEQNQILLQILGVTEFIAYQEVKENSDQYNMSYLKTLLDSMFTGLFNALMYGENTVDDYNTDTASIQSFSVSNAAASVAVYSDDIAVYDSGGSGGGSSFGGGSDSSGGHFFDLKNGLFGKFPFSIPYQCYNWLQILQRDPEAPTFTLDYGYLFGSPGVPEYVLTFDLSRYNDIAEVGRSFCRLFMTLMLALGIYHKNKGEM